MTKEEQLESDFEDCFDKCTRPTQGGYGPDTTDQSDLWDKFKPYIQEYAKQQAIAFAIDYAECRLTWLKELRQAPDPTTVASDRMEERYQMFLTKQTENK